MASLRSAAIECEFHDLDDSLLEQLVCRVRDIQLQQRLLARTDITLQISIDEACASEMSDKSTTKMRGAHSAFPPAHPVTVHYEDDVSDDTPDEEPEVSHLKSVPGKKAPGKKTVTSACLGCGENHPRSLCCFKAAICWRCGKKGHLAKVCRAAVPEHPSSDQRSFRRPQRSPAKSGEDCFTICGDDATPVVSTCQVSSGFRKKIYLTVKIEGVSCQMEVDTGSSRSIIAWATLHKLMPILFKSHLSACSTRLCDYQGNSFPIVGQVNLWVEKGNFSGYLPIIIIRGHLPSLLGLDWFEALGLTVSGIHSTAFSDGFDALTTEFAGFLMTP